MVAITATRGGEQIVLKPMQLVLISVLFGFFLGRMGGSPTIVYESSRHLSEKEDSSDNLSSADTEYLRTPSKAVLPAASTALAPVPVQDENGWHSINVYYGDREELLKPWLNKHKKFSQEGQDKLVLSMLKNKRNGFFVDLASNHPIMLSNTFLMEHKYGWNGLCIEPNWQYWNGLASLRKCHVVAAVGGGIQSEAIKFRFHPFKRFVGAFGGIVGDQFDNKPSKNNNNEVIEETRFTIALADILKKFNAPKVIDYMSLDVEGAEEYIMKEFPFDEYKFLVMNVERPTKEVTAILLENGYRMLKEHQTAFGDTTWVHESLKIA